MYLLKGKNDRTILYLHSDKLYDSHIPIFPNLITFFTE
jgi:hypothetical protein